MKKCKLGELLKIKHGYAFKSENYVKNSKYVLVTLANISETNNFQFNSEKITYYGADFPEDFVLKKGDLIMPLTEQVVGLFGNSAFVPHIENITFVLNQRVGKVIPKKDRADKYFLHYLLSTKSVREQLEYRASGTRQRNISPNDIYDVEVFVPDYEMQKKIGETLYKLEERVNNNNRINEELESMAKTIYDYWFLQFDFPDENGKPYKSSGGEMVWNEELKKEIPEGWRVAGLKDIASITMGTSPKGDSINTDGKGIAFYQGKADFGNRFPITRTYTNAPIRYADIDDILLSVRAPVGTLNIANKKCCIGRGLAAIHSKYSSFVFYLLLANQYKFDVYNNGGTTFGAITKDNLFGMRVVIPKESVIDEFEKKINCINQKIFRNDEESQELVSLRDFLLPLLMNGQVSFNI